MKNLLFLFLISLSFCLGACQSGDHPIAHLPYPGNYDLRPNPKGGPDDTIRYPVPPFHLTDQAGHLVTNQTLAGHAYITDFFFTTCPGICPQMQSGLLGVFKHYTTDPRLGFLSVTIDPAHDTVAVLQDYAHRLGVADAGRWHFATTGNRDTSLALANHLLEGAMADSLAPGGYAHSGNLALVDDRGYIRGAYSGLQKPELERLEREIPVLLDEIAKRKK